MERSNYIQQCLEKHLLNGNNYQLLSEEEALEGIDWANIELICLFGTYQYKLSDQEVTYFDWSFNETDRRTPPFTAIRKSTRKQ
jgi:hypothetical protein